MRALVETANQIAQEIERTRQHLTNLEQALEGLKPLITIDEMTSTLPYSTMSQPESVEDLSIVNADVPTRKKAKPKPKLTEKVKKVKKVKPAPAVIDIEVAATVKLPATGAEVWLKCIGRKKLSLGQIVDTALKQLELDDSARGIITNRVTAWANAAVKKGVLIPAGTRDGYKLFQRASAKDEKAVVSSGAVDAAQGAEFAEGQETT
ncbi:MAG: hypothetical protein ACOYNF_12465 [Rhodoferax sp.]